MAKWQSPYGWRRWLYTRPAIIIVLILGIFFARAVWQSFWRERLVINERRDLELELAKLQERGDKLEQEILELKTDAGLRSRIREKFLVVEEGEKVINVVANNTATPTLATSSESWWRSLWSE